MLNVVNTLAPVVLLISLGAFLRRIRLMPAAMAAWASTLTYWVALPALLFVETSGMRTRFSDHADAFAAIIAATAVCIGAGYAIAALMRLPTPSAAALVQAGYRGNLAYIGIPVIVYSANAADSTATAIGMLMVASVVPVYNMAAVVVLLGTQHRFRLSSMGPLFLRVLSNPLILACAAGMAWAWTGMGIPSALSRTLEPLGRMALPLALLSIGGSLDPRQVHGVLRPVAAASAIKLLLAPLIGLVMARLLGLRGDELRIVLFMLSCPTASASYVMAANMGADSHLTAGAIVMSTILSLIPLAAVSWILAG